MSAPESTPVVLSLVLALALLALTGTTDGAITCEAVTTRYESTVTCFFGTDIFDTKHSFNLQFYYPNLQADPETHLMCNWVTSETMSCKESPGVAYDHVLADQITVKGRADPRRVGGKYVCQVLPQLDGPVKPCNLTYLDVTTTTTTTTTQPMALEDLMNKVNNTLILSGLILIIALIILIAVLFVVCTRVKLAERIRKWRMWKKKEPDEEKPEKPADAGEKGTGPEKEPLLNVPESNPEQLNEVKVKGECGKEEAVVLEMKPTPTPPSAEAGQPVEPRTEETQLAGKEGAGMSGLSTNEDDQPKDGKTKEAKKKKGFFSGRFGKKSSSSARKEQEHPGPQNLTGTGDPPEANKDSSSGKGKKKSGKTNGKKGEGEMELSGNQPTQQPPSTGDGGEAPRGGGRDK